MFFVRNKRYGKGQSPSHIRFDQMWLCVGRGTLFGFAQQPGTDFDPPCQCIETAQARSGAGGSRFQSVNAEPRETHVWADGWSDRHMKWGSFGPLVVPSPWQRVSLSYESLRSYCRAVNRCFGNGDSSPYAALPTSVGCWDTEKTLKDGSNHLSFLTLCITYHLFISTRFIIDRYLSLFITFPSRLQKMWIEQT